MASALRIVDLNGKTINVVRGQDQTWSEVVSRANLPSRFEFCLRHWMSDDPIDTATEEHIKQYLDRVGYILIQDKPDSTILTDYKELRDKVALVPVSGLPQLENLFYGSLDEMTDSSIVPARESSERMTKVEAKVYGALMRPKKVPKTITKLQEKRKRIDHMRSNYPGVATEFVRVDTGNEFEYRGKRYKVDGLKQYEPKVVRDDLLYDMDHIVCITADDGAHFYDEDFVEVTDHVVAT